MNTAIARAASTISYDKVKDPDGRPVGVIEDLVVDLEQGTVAYVILSCAGYLGNVARRFAIPWSSLWFNADERSFYIGTYREVLEHMRGYDADGSFDCESPRLNGAAGAVGGAVAVRRAG